MLAGLPQADDPNLLVGYNTNDDAGIYRLSDELAIVVTADFITPPVNDPFQFGQIAAANALSDVYAMGGDPKVCLNLVSFPSKLLPADHLNRIVAGALDKITEAGAVLAGGHSVEDAEPKFGLSVVGVVHPDRFWANGGARPGDVLVLTKPLGSGVLFNANLKQWVPADAMDACVRVVSTLNRAAAQVMQALQIHAVTDVTGFGLAGHALEVAKASDAALHLQMAALPIMDQALAMYRKGMTTGSNAFNRQLATGHLVWEGQWPERHQEILFDPQTSGGLLVALPEADAEQLVASLKAIGSPAAHVIGRVAPLKGQRHLVIA
ncbi:MAG: selenide, water dikinase SelD [Desulfatitalea sp.]|nr:selenide, water dikinase SelD [Desulfatitalea sp.]NNK00416.1 selenide, water dikinase SelD [Desulfatitalea sp.]